MAYRFKYVIFKEERPIQYGESRQLSRTGSATDILAEWYLRAETSAPNIGDRLLEFAHIDENGVVDLTRSKGSTHQRLGDWQVTRVEEYVANLPVGQDYEEIVVCYCQYVPIEPNWKSIPKTIVSVDSFEGDRSAFQTWIDSTPNASDLYRIILPKDPVELVPSSELQHGG